MNHSGINKGMLFKQNPGLNQFGGKAYQLTRLRDQGFLVPSFFVLSTQDVNLIFKDALAKIEQLFSSPTKLDASNLGKTCQIAQNLLMGTNLQGFEAEIQEILARSIQPGTLLAVRSSAVDEDSKKASFAGQHASFLYASPSELPEKIKACVASAWSESAIQYRIFHQLSVYKIEIAVIIQEMITADKSGVGFSVNIHGNLNDAVLVAGYGPGQGIVQDQSDSDTYFINRQTRSIRKSIQHKQQMLNHSADLQPVEVEINRQDQSVLTDDETARIYLLLRKAEELLGAFADIEFACTENDEIYLLQARPITGIEQAKLIILDNTNIVESFPDISLPLSYSFASLTYEKVFRASLSAFGISDNQLENSDELFQNLLAHFKGRIYYRLDNWYILVNQVYPSSSLKKSWRDAVGLIESENLSKNISLSHKIKVWTRILYLILTYRFWTRRFFIAFDKLYLHFRSWKSQSLTPAKLWDHFSESIEKGLESWPYTLLNDYLAFALVGWVKKAANQLGVLPENTGEEELFPGNEEMESRQAVMHFNGLLAIITADEPISQSFQSQPADKLLEIIEDAKHPSLTKAWKNYIERFGDRALAELKMETQTPRVNPVVLIDMIQAHLHPYSSNQLNFKQLQFDSNAGLALIRKRFHPLHPLYYPLKFLIRITSKGLSNRENMRFCRARIFGASREIFLEFGRLLAEKKIIAVTEDVFYLELSDIESFAKGNHQPLFQKVEARKLEFASFSDLTPPDRIIFEEGKDFVVPLIQGSEENSEGILRGTGVSKGSCEAEAIILLKPEFNQVVKGKILVTKMTDPGWVFLMSQAAGIISERGSLLSHTAIIGRELGIPVIVGVKNATRLIQNGQRISIDGLWGTIQIMES